MTKILVEHQLISDKGRLGHRANKGASMPTFKIKKLNPVAENIFCKYCKLSLCLVNCSEEMKRFQKLNESESIPMPFIFILFTTKKDIQIFPLLTEGINNNQNIIRKPDTLFYYLQKTQNNFSKLGDLLSNGYQLSKYFPLH